MLINSVNHRVSSAKERKRSKTSSHYSSKCLDVRPQVQCSLHGGHSIWHGEGPPLKAVYLMFSFLLFFFFFHRRVKEEAWFSVSFPGVGAVAISDCIISYYCIIIALIILHYYFLLVQSSLHILGYSLLFVLLDQINFKAGNDKVKSSIYERKI